ncbi:hypothetical protein F511_19452 [Dorcoceras hygrometricum]|uniref:Uncharacterized protein n=1 Tax=Dorcoceras hygrometricum TaxID=472368 RepID=A0A2Z6ZYR3_9LAMI|nr:hypothetical protein F511_19452 [Dorcoceras hygrometricum]
MRRHGRSAAARWALVAAHHRRWPAGHGASCCAMIDARWCGDARHRVRPCVARDLLAAAAAVRPPSGESPASLRRLIFLLGLVRACSGQP